MSGKEEEKIEKAKPTIDERIEELKAENKEPREITQILYEEGYSTHDIMRRHLPLKSLKKVPESEDSVMGAIAGTTKGAGYLDEFKTMIQRQIARSRELTEVFSNVGLGVLLASLRKSGLSMDDFRRIAMKQEGLKEALEKAGETAFKALEYYQSDLIKRVEDDRDEARSYACVLETKFGALAKQIDPKFRLERMIHTYLLSGNVAPETLMSLIDKWLEIEITEARLEMVTAA